MCSFDSDDLMSMSLPVTKLVKHFKHSFRERDFDEFGEILMNRENSFSFKKEIENLKRDPRMTKQVVTLQSLLDRNGDPVDLEKLLFEELLGKEQRKCQRLKEKVIQLTEEKDKLADHVKSIDKKRDMLFMEILKTENAKNNLFSELGKSKRKCQELEVAVTQLTEEKRMLIDNVKMADEKRDMISMEKMKLENERNGLISELAKNRTNFRELEVAVTLLTVEKKTLTDYVKVAEEINQKMENEKNNSISELNEKINDLKNQNLESELFAGVYQEKCRYLDNKIAKMEQEMAQRKLESGKVVEELMQANKAIEDLRMEKIGSDKTLDVTSLSNGIKNNGLSTKGDGNSVQRLAKEGIDDAHKHKASSGKQSGHSLKKENNEPKEPLGSGAHLGGKELHSSSSKSARSPPGAARTIIDITDNEEGIDDKHKIQTSPVNELGHKPPQEGNDEPKETLGSGAHSTKSAHSSTAVAMTVIDIIDSDDEVTHRIPTPQRSKRNRTRDKCTGGVEASPSKKKNQKCGPSTSEPKSPLNWVLERYGKIQARYI